LLSKAVDAILTNPNARCMYYYILTWHNCNYVETKLHFRRKKTHKSELKRLE